MYKWNNNTGKLDVIENNNERYGMEYNVRSIIITGGSKSGSAGYYNELIMPWGGLKAVKLDINGDGTDEIAVEGIRSRFFERLHRTDSKCYASYKAYPYIALVSMDKSSGKLK